MVDLAARIEALTDEECLSLTEKPWSTITFTRDYGESHYLTHGGNLSRIMSGQSDLAIVQREADRRNAAEFRERLRGLMGRG